MRLGSRCWLVPNATTCHESRAAEWVYVLGGSSGGWTNGIFWNGGGLGPTHCGMLLVGWLVLSVPVLSCVPSAFLCPVLSCPCPVPGSLFGRAVLFGSVLAFSGSVPVGSWFGRFGRFPRRW